jgi:hypothetical protein
MPGEKHWANDVPSSGNSTLSDESPKSQSLQKATGGAAISSGVVLAPQLLAHFPMAAKVRGGPGYQRVKHGEHRR